MRFRNTPHAYGAVARTLHWSIALLVIGLTGLGIYMVDLGYFDRYYNLSLEVHKALGILVLELALIKIGWTLVSRPPAPVAGVRRWERRAAAAVHATLYAMMVSIPFSGYALSTSDGKPVSFFGWYEVPALLPRIEGLGRIAGEAHYYLAYLTAALVGLHAAAALKHHFVDRDATLRRMM